MKEMLIIFTYTFIIAFIAINLNKAMPYVKQRWNAFITRKKRKSNTPKQAVDATTYFELLSRIETIEKRLNRRQTNFQQRVREEVRRYLEQLKK